MIAATQNTPPQLSRLAAQRQLYATAKTVFVLQCFVGGAIAAATAWLGLKEPALKGYIAAWGGAATLIDALLLSRWQQKLRTRAATVQEAFDCDVLQLPWNATKVGARPEPELIQEQEEKYQRQAKQMPPLTDWYCPALSELPHHIARIACQRSNCVWDSKQRRRYAACVVVILVSLSIGLISFALKASMPMTDFFISLVAPFMPIFGLGIRQFNEQADAAARLERLKDHADALWKDALAGNAAEELTARSRSLQDEIYESRKRSPLVFDWVFRLLRPSYQRQMSYAAETLIAEARVALRLTGPTL